MSIQEALGILSSLNNIINNDIITNDIITTISEDNVKAIKILLNVIIDQDTKTSLSTTTSFTNKQDLGKISSKVLLNLSRITDDKMEGYISLLSDLENDCNNNDSNKNNTINLNDKKRKIEEPSPGVIDSIHLRALRSKIQEALSCIIFENNSHNINQLINHKIWKGNDNRDVISFHVTNSNDWPHVIQFVIDLKLSNPFMMLNITYTDLFQDEEILVYLRGDGDLTVSRYNIADVYFGSRITNDPLFVTCIVSIVNKYTTDIRYPQLHLLLKSLLHPILESSECIASLDRLICCMNRLATIKDEKMTKFSYNNLKLKLLTTLSNERIDDMVDLLFNITALTFVNYLEFEDMNGYNEFFTPMNLIQSYLKADIRIFLPISGLWIPGLRVIIANNMMNDCVENDSKQITNCMSILKFIYNAFDSNIYPIHIATIMRISNNENNDINDLTEIIKDWEKYAISNEMRILMMHILITTITLEYINDEKCKGNFKRCNDILDKLLNLCSLLYEKDHIMVTTVLSLLIDEFELIGMNHTKSTEYKNFTTTIMTFKGKALNDSQSQVTSTCTLDVPLLNTNNEVRGIAYIVNQYFLDPNSSLNTLMKLLPNSEDFMIRMKYMII